MMYDIRRNTKKYINAEHIQHSYHMEIIQSSIYTEKEKEKEEIYFGGFVLNI